MTLSKASYLIGDRRIIDGSINFVSFGYLKIARGLWKFLDIKAIDLFINWLAMFILSTGRRVSFIQTGLINNYIFFLLLGIVLILGIMLYGLNKVKGQG